ncbi:tail fiber protein [Pseudomonas silvicola]|nr:tail fiber protein [Pseudomonas silvicola]
MSDFFLGEIRWFPFDFAPQGWLPCDGRTLSISTNQALFALLGTSYGGNGSTTFQLPDLRGRTVVSRSLSDPNYSLGQVAGVETVTLTTAQMPPHSHSLNVASTVGTAASPAAGTIASVGGSGSITAPSAFAAPGASPVPLNPGSVSSSGTGTPHNNLQPYQVLNPCIAVQGLYPPRS